MRIGKLWELAAIPDMPSQPTLRAFIRSRPDFPVITTGSKGTAYVFDLDAAASFVRAHWRDMRAELSGSARANRGKPAVGSQARQDMFPGLLDGEQRNGSPR
ncbi:MAG TPA: hypothetical protein VF695_08360 [Sphingomonas sp.]|jgi:hypothetical protein